MLIVVLVWAVAALLLVHALYGPDRWYYAVTAHVRPGAARPAARGRRLLVLRDWLLVAAAVAVAVPVTLDRLPPSDDELAAAVDEAFLLAPPDGLTESRLEAQLRQVLDRDDVTVDRYLPEGSSGSRTIEPGVPLTDRWDVRIGADSAGDDGSAGACATVETTYDTAPGSNAFVVEPTGVEAGACG
ncbi:hypothetical protein GCM10023340_07350 [Nocardioides marinquilinus]|uniref:Uncharacterized protein n=1 Tax=Nocardioides marinquilinus TaxID=1210400 RepID=A0ABP9PD13_9ACTN